jgi:hypothetical protein
MKKLKFLTSLILVICSLPLFAQTTELITHLKGDGSINIRDIKVDNNNRIIVIGNLNKSNINNFNPNGTAFNYPSIAGGSNQEGFIAAYNGSTQELEHLAIIGNATGSATDGLVNLELDASNNIYFSGISASSPLYYYNVYPNTSTILLGAGPNTFIAKINNDFTGASTTNTLVIKAVTGTVNDKVTNFKLDDNYLYVTGRFESANVEFNPKDAVANTKKLSSVGLGDIFVAKYNLSDLKNVFAYRLGDVNDDYGQSIDVDNNGNIYLTGTFRGTVNMDRTAVATPLTEYAAGTVGDMFLAKYNSSLDHQWSMALGTGQIDEGTKVLVDPSTGSLFMLGLFKKDAVNLELNPLGTSVQIPLTGNFMSVVAKYNTSGILQWNTPLKSSSTGTINAKDIQFFGTDDIIVIGNYTVSLDAGNSQTLTNLGATDAFLSIHDASLGITDNLYQFGGAGSDLGMAISVKNTKVYTVFDALANGDYDPFGSLPNIVHTGNTSTLFATYNLCNKPTITTQPVSQTECAGNSVSFSVAATSADAITYVWKKGTTAIPSATNSSYTINPLATGDAGNYTVEVTNGCGTTISDIATLTVNPVITAGSIAGDQTICSGGNPVAFTQTTAATGGTGTFTYQWQSAVSPFSTYTDIAVATSPIYDVPAGLTATTKYRRKDISGTCTSPVTNILTVTVNPIVTPSVSQTVDVNPNCINETVNFDATPIGGGTAPTYEWFVNNVSQGAPSTTNNGSIDMLVNGDKVTVKMTSNALCASPATVTSNEITMTIITPTFSTGISGVTSVTPNQSNVSFNVPSTTCMTYNWTVPAGASIVSGQGTNAIVVNFGATGGVVSVTENNGVTTNTLNLVVSATTSTNSALANAITIYPNPITTEAYIQSTIAQDAVVSVCDVNGNVLKTFTISNMQSPTEIGSTLPKGMYVLKIQAGDQLIIKKIIKE